MSCVNSVGFSEKLMIGFPAILNCKLIALKSLNHYVLQFKQNSQNIIDFWLFSKAKELSMDLKSQQTISI
jgi:hypothetical protein